MGLDPTQLEDASLVERARRGDLTAFNAIVERYQGQVFGVAARILGDRHAAEDVTQEAFFSAHRALRGFRGGSLRAWLLRIATNASFDYLRATRRGRAQSLDLAMESAGSHPVSRDPSPETQAEQAELAATIQRALLALPGDQRAVVVLVDVEGLAYEEAAEATGVSLGTVKSRLSRARSRLRDILRAQPGFASSAGGSAG